MAAAAPADFAAKYSLAAHLCHGVCILTSQGLSLSHFNAAIGIGSIQPVTSEILDCVLTRFKNTGSTQFYVHIAEGASGDDLLAAHGLTPVGASHRVIRDAFSFSGALPASELPGVEGVTATTAEEWAAFLDRIYGLPTAPWLLGFSLRQGWHHYILREAGSIVAARSMFIDPANRAWLGIDGPVPGIMTNRYDRDFALVAVMVKDGIALGARAFFTDIEASLASLEGPSYEGFAGLGFHPAYLRRHFISGVC